MICLNIYTYIQEISLYIIFIFESSDIFFNI